MHTAVTTVNRNPIETPFLLRIWGYLTPHPPYIIFALALVVITNSATLNHQKKRLYPCIKKCKKKEPYELECYTQNMVNSRNKGAVFERQLVGILNEFFAKNNLDVTCKRNLDQYQLKNECDIPIPFHAVEAKHYKEGNWLKSAWWNQVCDSANGRIPVLAFKFNRIPIRVCIPLHAINPEWEEDNQKVAVLPIEDWLEVLKKNWQYYKTRANSV